MKIKFVLLLSLLVLSSCRINKPEQELNKSEKELNKEHEYKIISLKGDLSYDEICDLVGKNAWNYIKSAVVKELDD